MHIHITGAANVALHFPPGADGIALPPQIDVAPAPQIITPGPRFTFIGEGCFRDALQPGWEFTPTLNQTGAPQAECERIARECTLLGGGWELPDDPLLLARLVSYDHHQPATFPELAADTRSDWYWTRKRTAWSSGLVWFVYFGGGSVSDDGPGGSGFARGVRRVAVSPGQ